GGGGEAAVWWHRPCWLVVGAVLEDRVHGTVFPQIFLDCSLRLHLPRGADRREDDQPLRGVAHLAPAQGGGAEGGGAAHRRGARAPAAARAPRHVDGPAAAQGAGSPGTGPAGRWPGRPRGRGAAFATSCSDRGPPSLAACRSRPSWISVPSAPRPTAGGTRFSDPRFSRFCASASSCSTTTAASTSATRTAQWRVIRLPSQRESGQASQTPAALERASSRRGITNTRSPGPRSTKPFRT